MNDCQYSQQLGPYLDGELTPAAAASLEAHVAQCPPCSAELGELRALGRMFAADRDADIPVAARDRLHDHVDALLDRGLLRIGRILSGIAACLLLGSALWLNSADRPATPPVAAAGWEKTAVLMPAPPAPVSADEMVSPEWVLADLSGASGGADEMDILDR